MSMLHFASRAPRRAALLSLAFAMLFVATLARAQRAVPAIVPRPASIEMLGGPAFRVRASTRIVYEDREAPRAIERSLAPLAAVLAEEIELLTGMRPSVAALSATASRPQARARAGAAPTRAGEIRLRFVEPERGFARDEAGEEHGYRLDVSAEAVTIAASYYKGVAHGSATLLQALRFEDERAELPCMRVRDRPEAPYRAVMVDVARQVHSLGVLRDVIRMARLYKIRYLHLHLTDDQNFTFPYPPVTSKLARNFVYPRRALLELVAYADARGVTLIPELDLPGHSSMLRKSGYLVDAKNDGDVAAPRNFAKIHAIVDDMLSVFASSPYFHIGGDESSAGAALLPFLASVNRHLRARREGERRRLLVWEGFHGAPTEALPARGEDRVVVLAWESSYNPPWKLLDAGYEIINASWKPLYVVGGGGFVHPGSSGGRRWSARTIHRWDKDCFMHWEPGRPVYEDRGPGDADRTDHEWRATAGRERILGGQLLFWEQAESTVLANLASRIAALSESLWNPAARRSYTEFAARARAASKRVLPIVQPVEILPRADEDDPVHFFYRAYEGEAARVELRNRSRVAGALRFEVGRFDGALTGFRFRPVPAPSAKSAAYEGPIRRRGGFSIRAQLFREDGSAVPGTTWASFHNWPNRVAVAKFRIDPKSRKVPDLAAMPTSASLGAYHAPMLRGPFGVVGRIGLMHRAVLRVPQSGTFKIAMKTQSGHATLRIDANRDGRFDQAEILIRDTPSTEQPLTAELVLEAGKAYALRVDHRNDEPRPVLIVTLEGPGLPKRSEISPYLSLPSK